MNKQKDYEGIKRFWPEYDIVKELGAGGFGNVYEIRRTYLGNTLSSAVKIIHIPRDQYAANELRAMGMTEVRIKDYYKTQVNAFLNENLVMEKLKSASNIVTIEDSKVEQDWDTGGYTIYIKMELLTSMDQLLMNHMLDAGDIATIANDICSALIACEQMNIIHRDIKPANIFISDFGTFKLGDFGIARQMQHERTSMTQIGTSQYMAPELYAGLKADKRVDIYSLGIMLYRLANYGCFPFVTPNEVSPEKNQEALAIRLSGAEIPLPPQVDEELGKIIVKACAKDPNQRFQSAKEFKQAINRWQIMQEYEISKTDQSISKDKQVLEENKNVIPIEMDFSREKNNTAGYGKSAITGEREKAVQKRVKKSNSAKIIAIASLLIIFLAGSLFASKLIQKNQKTLISESAKSEQKAEQEEREQEQVTESKTTEQEQVTESKTTEQEQVTESKITDTTEEKETNLQAEEGKVLNIQVWNEEFQSRVEDYVSGYEIVDETSGRIGDVEVRWTITPADDYGYLNHLDQSLLNQESAAADDKVDLFLIEADYATKYVESDYTMPIEELGITEEDLANQYQYTKDIVTDDGKQKGVTWQGVPGVLIYNRKIAKEVLGTDDPAQVQKALKDWDTYKATAAKMKNKGYFMTSSVMDSYRVFSNNVTSPWVVDGKINIDNNLMNWVEMSKAQADAKQTNTYDLWSDDWAKGFFPEGKVFCYFGPGWFIDFSMAADTAGSIANAGGWAAVEGPQSFFWGGTWICAATGTDNAKLIKDIMVQLTTDKDTMIKIVEEKNDFVNHKAAMEEMAASDYQSKVLGGQNPLPMFCASADRIEMKYSTGYDETCNEEFQNSMRAYFDGIYSRDEAIKYFYNAVTEKHPELDY